MIVDGNKTAKTIQYTLLIALAVLTLLPMLLALVGGFKNLAQLRLDLFGWPDPFLWENYVDVLHPKRSRFFLSLFNSMLIMSTTVMLGVILSSFAGFALSRIKFPGRELIFNFFLVGLLFPPAVAILPLYVQLKNMYLLDNYFGVILPQVAFALPMQIMLVRSFFKQIPMELEESATIDGCTQLQFLVRIVIPLSKPVLTTIAILAMVGSWNSYFLPLLILNSEKYFTLPMGVMSFASQYVYNWPLVLAYITLAMVPAVIFYMLAQKYIIEGLTSGAVKQ
ncbi:MAG TPA: carbohydrate ABC transporter permease, partial [Petrotogaceae bacterium]|nr:carbohydrate ABC transporter permease [Spirochaetota bacterium]HQP59179.1 carbohydrate ABC transporter permease [Petrotogaceae bacterium]HPA63972.1 carbohydrate ABC transporter permease [Spirochaetota bacterium]HPY03642.1 carbohydrate ABC transporter permease [Spirochaetota bacterium]HQA51875.1 carbohydrate ABC transporter permease [Spirochaetota bacterium]